MIDKKIATFLVYKTGQKSYLSKQDIKNEIDFECGIDNTLYGRILLYCSGNQFLDYFQKYNKETRKFDTNSDNRLGGNINLKSQNNFTQETFNNYIYKRITEYLKICKKELKEYHEKNLYVDDSEFNLWGKYVNWQNLINDELKERRMFTYFPEINYKNLLIKDLSSLEKEIGGVKESEFNELKKHLTGKWPSEVIEFFRKVLPDTLPEVRDALKDEYLDIKVNNIKWEKEVKTTEEIIGCSFCFNFHPYFNEKIMLGEEIDLSEEKSRFLSDDRFRSWKDNKTWFTPPLFLCKKSLDSKNKNLSLLDGYTRMGILKGLLNTEKISLNDKHEIFVGYFE